MEFEDCNKIYSSETKYITATKLPNWDNREISIGDIGFLEYENVSAGQEYYNPHQEIKIMYKYDNSYFFNFIPEQIYVEQDYTM